jgi:hypothetical protein
MCGRLKKLLVFGISCIFLLAVTSHASPLESQNKEPEQSPETKQRAAPTERGSKDLPVIVEIAPSAPLKVETEHGREAENEKTSNERWIANGTVALALVTAVLAAATIGLMVFTFKLWKATNKLVEGSDNTARKELRAYMGVDRIVIYDDFLSSNSGHVELRIKNFGNTMAKSTQIWIEASEPVAEPNFNERGEKKAKTVVMPKEALGFKASINRTTDCSMSKVLAGAIRIWGRIEYADVFGQERWTTFRFINDSREAFDSPGGKIYGWSVKTDQEGNDAE